MLCGKLTGTEGICAGDGGLETPAFPLTLLNCATSISGDGGVKIPERVLVIVWYTLAKAFLI